MIGVKNWGKGLKIAIHDNGTLIVDCNIQVKYGYAVVDVAKAAQAAAISAIASMTNVKAAAININVCGIVRQ